MPNARQTHRSEFLVANRNRVLRAPVLIGLQARGEEIDIRFEWRLECLIPVLQVGQNRQRLRSEGIQPRHESVGDFALIHKHAACDSRTVSLPPF
jgi:hypothetical protein